MMHDVLIIKSQIETIRHNNKSTSMTTEEWRSLDQIARSTIRMHLAENVYFNIAKEKIAFALWEKLSSMYEKKSSSSKLILIRQLFNMKIRETGPTTSHINPFTWVLTGLSSQGLNFKEEIKACAPFEPPDKVGSLLHDCYEQLEVDIWCNNPADLIRRASKKADGFQTILPEFCQSDLVMGMTVKSPDRRDTHPATELKYNHPVGVWGRQCGNINNICYEAHLVNK